MRNRIKVVVIGGKITIIKKRKTLFGNELSSTFVCSESPKHAQSSIRKVAAYRRRLLDAPQNVKMHYTAKQRTKLRSVFSNIQDYCRAIGIEKTNFNSQLNYARKFA